MIRWGANKDYKNKNHKYISETNSGLFRTFGTLWIKILGQDNTARINNQNVKVIK